MLHFIKMLPLIIRNTFASIIPHFLLPILLILTLIHILSIELTVYHAVDRLTVGATLSYRNVGITTWPIYKFDAARAKIKLFDLKFSNERFNSRLGKYTILCFWCVVADFRSCWLYFFFFLYCVHADKFNNLYNLSVKLYTIFKTDYFHVNLYP